MTASEGTMSPPKPKNRLVGIDAARGLALIGLMAVHLYPSAVGDTSDPTLAWTLFGGDSAALFALLAGVGLALSSGGRTQHRGRQMNADRVGVAVRAVMIGIVALAIAAIMPADPPAYGILLYYSAFFLLAIPFLHFGIGTLFLSAAAFAVVSPILIQQLYPVLPGSSLYNHTLVTLFTEPAGVASELLITGSYPALSFMPFILVGLGLGRLNLRSTRIQAIIAGAGAALAVLANLASSLLLHAVGGYEALLETPDMTRDSLDEALMFGPSILPDTSGWWLAIATPHSGATLAIASSLGMALLVLALFLLIGAKAGRWLAPLAAMGAMTLTLYSAHLLALAPEVHYDEPTAWFVVHLVVAATFAWIWRRSVGQGPLELIVTRAVRGARLVVIEGTPDTAPTTTTNGTARGTPDGITREPRNGPSST
ncbi:heparan-alpha-glucosaminide N-acetyltransferase domain-containing protein [Citricoccus alkalitolerans]|uniref:Heparan-alpha-glucosaminide N-acetyltransferase domain-containing protein n=1 Tax=Citricoccus alkalitolerans TaxID=246603 RepID=A0ABV8XVI0_9MICC